TIPKPAAPNGCIRPCCENSRSRSENFAPPDRPHASEGSEDVLGLQEPVRLPRIRSRLRARTAISNSHPMDSVPASNQGQGRAQSLLRTQGALLVSRRAPMGQTARPGYSRAAEGL